MCSQQYSKLIVDWMREEIWRFKVDCPVSAGVLGCDLAIAPEIAGGKDE